MKTVSALVLAALLMVSPGQAFAQPLTVKVSYADLDLSRAEGRSVLERRLERAIRQVCLRPETMHVRGQKDYRECNALTRGKVDVQLAALFERSKLADSAVTIRLGS